MLPTRARLAALLVALLALGALVSCGGGGSKAAPQGRSDWDVMLWDQDVWS